MTLIEIGVIVTIIGTIVGGAVSFGVSKGTNRALYEEVKRLDSIKANADVMEARFNAINEKLDLVIDLIKNGRRYKK